MTHKIMHSLKYILCFAVLATAYGKPSQSILSKGYRYSAKTDNYYKSYVEVSDWRVWQEAVATCRSVGGQLFYPVDEAEAIEVDTLMRPWGFRADALWIGISDLRSAGVYETIDGRPLNEVYNKWDARYDQPKKYNEGDNCVCMWSKYDLWVGDCLLQRPFICKYIQGKTTEASTVATASVF